ncbi:MAG: HPF/RaiA family ribosome-associated protein, partial [Bdellovibrionaceae bacterium]|nr:HPF/RaiA family ribosome-associated protein [Pseudobdellovibrionaceae bacterium]
EKFFKATASAPDIYVAVDLMADKLEKQFLKIKEIYVDHKKFEASKEGKLRDTNSQMEYKPKWRKAG